MSGDQRTDGQDPLDDDFVIEDLAGKNDDLESLFTAPANPKAPAPPGGEPADADDVLFTDHTQGVKPSEKFQEGAAFAEQGKSQWNGDNLELDQAGAKDGQASDELAEEEFGPDSEKELELVDGGGTTDGVNEFEQSGPFVLDDSEGAWQDDSAAAAASAEGEGEGSEAAEGESAEPALVEDEAPIEPGWEPLPEGSVDELSEVGEVARTDDEAGGEQMHEGAEPALVGADVDGHDIYAEDTPPALVGPRPAGRRALRLLTSLAASLLVLGGGAVVVMRPEWFGLAFEPARVQQVRIERPQVQVAVNTPPAPQPTKVEPQPTEPKDPVAVVLPPVEVPTVPPPEPTPEPTPVPVPPVSNEPNPTPVVTAPPANDWPVKEGRVGEQAILTGREKQRTMVRLGDDLMVGDVDVDKRPVRAVDGVMPGSRAFAQLHNGNYFIGSVKNATDEQVTLRLDDGEITIARVDLARLTELGSADYEQLQRVTSGFVRLTNNNRLVGGILSQIADDHIVLEFRSNRVMLPKSAVGQVVRGDDDGGVRLDVTPQEDDWLKTIAERQLGSGTAPGMPPAGTAPAPQAPATRPTAPPAAPTTGATPPPARPR